MALIALVALFALVPIVGAAPRAAETKDVNIKDFEFDPKAITVNVGDTIHWKNNGQNEHTAQADDGSFDSGDLEAGKEFSFTFTKAGRYRYEDSTVQPRQRGTITVRAGLTTVSIAAAPTTVTFGRGTVLSGRVSSGRAGEKVTISAKRCRDNAYKKLVDVTTTTDGAWSLTTKPLDHTIYRAQLGPSTSDAAVRARPRISLAKIAAHKFRVRVFAAESFAGKAVVFQRWNATRRVWVRVKSVTLVDTGLGVDPTVISGSDFRSGIARGKRIRISMSPFVAGLCYAANVSGTIRS